MNWENFYLMCFVVGFVFAVIGFIGGSVHLPHPHGLHLPGFHGAHAPAHPSGLTHGGAHATSGAGPSISPFNFGTLMAFLAWFGGMGYLLTTRGNLTRAAILTIALASGFVGAAIVFGFLSRVMLRHERFLESADFELVGVLGRVTVPIRTGGTGEIVYSQEGTRRSSGARSDSGAEVPRGAEVVVTRYEKGIAYVRPWDELTGSDSESPDFTRESEDVSSAPN
jgi:membrane protein implicated in regulation of membrane protease activity